MDANSHNRPNRIPESISMEDILQLQMGSMNLNENRTHTNPISEMAFLPSISQPSSSSEIPLTSPYERVFRMSNSPNTQPQGTPGNKNGQKPHGVPVKPASFNSMAKPRPLASRESISSTERSQLGARKSSYHPEVMRPIKKSKPYVRQEVQKNVRQCILSNLAASEAQQREEAEDQPPSKPKKRVTFKDEVEFVYPPTSYLDFDPTEESEDILGLRRRY